jgi:cobalt-zinc-cadmium efflux system membrane fusion protein
MRGLLCLLALIPLIAATGCGESRPAEASTSRQESAAAQKGGDPPPLNQEEGMCREHGVLQALCTKCNPKLAVVFQAKGDWCAEHGFPESICPQCHPERGGRPAMDVSIDEAPADGTLVILKTREAARLAGIETTRALPAQGSAELTVPLVITYDPTRVAQVNARSAGVVKRLQADIGTRVAAGDPLAEIESRAVTADQSKLAAAQAGVWMTEENFRREAELEKKGISARKEVRAAEQAYREAVAERNVLKGSLQVVGAGENGGRYTLKAPFAGVITRRAVSIDEFVHTQAPLFEVVDTTSMWAELALPERDLGGVRTGLPVVITLPALEGRQFHGTITTIAPAIDPQTRTAQARVRLDNPEGLLRANMYGEARIRVGRSAAIAEVPRDAVQRAKTVNLVFVRLAENEFEARRVELGPRSSSGETMQLASGVQPGEEIVVAGSFFLKTETLGDAIGAGCCEVEQN